MSTPDTKPKAGLEDTVATTSAICYLDGDRGVLAYCGYDIHDLARHATFEEVCYLLWHRRLPTRAELGDLQSQLVAARPLPNAADFVAKRVLPYSDQQFSSTYGGPIIKDKFHFFGYYEGERNPLTITYTTPVAY